MTFEAEDLPVRPMPQSSPPPIRKRPVDPSGRDLRRRQDRRHDENERGQVARTDRRPGEERAQRARVRREPRARIRGAVAQPASPPAHRCRHAGTSNRASSAMLTMPSSSASSWRADWP
jgi:hypothetical protein